jgi:cyclopropane-fatty-acyl-phospholipid synthase
VDTFIDRYIFPGGYLPTIKQLLSAIHAGSKGGLEVETVQNIGPHYIRTLQCWRESFITNWATIRKNFLEKHKMATEDDVEFYRRRWLVSVCLLARKLPILMMGPLQYYFMYCEAGFRTRILGDYVISAVRTPEPNIPSNIPH